MERVIVTGATSMIGEALIEECLKHGISVCAVIRKDTARKDRLPQDPDAPLSKQRNPRGQQGVPARKRRPRECPSVVFRNRPYSFCFQPHLPFRKQFPQNVRL